MMGLLDRCPKWDVKTPENDQRQMMEKTVGLVVFFYMYCISKKSITTQAV